MVVQLFRNYQNSNYIYLFFITLFLHAAAIYHPTAAYSVVLFEPFVQRWVPISFGFLGNPMLNVFLSSLIVYFEAILLNQILVRYNILSKPSFVPALMFVVLSSLFSAFLPIQPVLIVNLFILWLIERIFAIYKTDNPIARAFDLGLIVSAGTFIYFPFITILPVIWIGLFIFLPFSWRIGLSGLLGFLVLYFFLAVYFYWNDDLKQFFSIFKAPIFRLPSAPHINLYQLLNVVPVGIALLLAVRYYQIHYSKNLIQIRKSLQVLFFLIVFSAVGFYFFYADPRYTLLHFLILAAPLSVYMSYYFIFAEKKWLYESLFISMVLFTLYFQFR